MSLRDLIPPHVHELGTYQPGKPIEEVERELGIPGAVKIASNENPLGPSPRAVEAARRALANAHYYPDGSYHRLRTTLAERLGLDPASIFIGAGSNEIIHLLVRTLCRPGLDEVLSHDNAFISYRLAAAACNVPFVASAVTPELRCDIDDLLARLSAQTRLIFLGHPNNPTGAALRADDVERIVAAKPETAILVVDEAYYEYAISADPSYQSAFRFLAADPTVVILRTFSKAYGLAGLRVGYGLMHPELAGYIHRIRRPFNVNAIAEAAAIAALDDQEHVRISTGVAEDSIRRLRTAAEMVGLESYSSVANFVLTKAESPARAQQVHERLLRSGIIVRPMSSWGLPTCLRLSVGTPEQTERAVSALERAVGAE